jgi:alpha-galactosidase
VAERVHALGLRFGLWVDLGEAAPDAPILRRQPELAARLRGTGRLAQGYQGAHLLCLHVAGEQVTEEQLRLIDTYQLDWLKFDQPQIAPCVDPRHGHGTSPETGGYANILALYRVLDRLRRERPGGGARELL